MVLHMVFDLDGTLFDTEKSVLLSWQNTLKGYGIEKTTEELRSVLGIPSEEGLKKIGITDMEEGFHQKLRDSSEIYPLFEGAKAFLISCRLMGIRLGIATSRVEDEVRKYFLRDGIEEYFSCVITADSTKERKPSPDPLLEYLRRTGAEKAETVFVGDMETDRECAFRAGIRYISVWKEDGRRKSFRGIGEEIHVCTEIG